MPEDRQGTGKHPHKSTEEPYPHHEASQSGEQEKSERRESRGESKESGSDSRDLKEREYRDNRGEVHHHTKTFEEQHGSEEEDKAA